MELNVKKLFLLVLAVLFVACTPDEGGGGSPPGGENVSNKNVYYVLIENETKILVLR